MSLTIYCSKSIVTLALAVVFQDSFLILTVASLVKCDKHLPVDQHCNRSYFINRKTEYNDVSGSDNAHRIKYKISIVESWINDGDRDRVTGVWKCVMDSKCNIVRRHHTQDSQQICTCRGSRGPELCVTVRCKHNSVQAQGIKCKYAISKSFDCSRTSKNSNKIRRTNTSEYKSDTITILQEVRINDFCSLFVDLAKQRIHKDDSTHISNQNQITILLDRCNFVTTFANSKKIFDIIDECSNEKSCQVFLNEHRRFGTLLCVLLHKQSICVVLKCKLNPKYIDHAIDRNSALGRRTSLATIWNHWKKEILLACTGVVLLSGIMGFLVGVRFSCCRKKTTKRHQAKTSIYLDSELYAEIVEASNETSKGPEQSNPRQTQIDAVRPDKYYIPPCDCNQRNKCEYDYSHVYNILQPNYGSKRRSHPNLSSLRTFDMTYSCQQYRSLQNISGQYLIQGRTSKISV